MQLYKRPPEPADFVESVKEHKKAVKEAIRAEKARLKAEAKKSRSSTKTSSKSLSRKRRKPIAKRSITFYEAWRVYKNVYAYAQFDKCGFCECKVLATGHGDVEHYRPKSEIAMLADDTTTHGRPQQSSASLEGRQLKVISDFGYWWLAYSWTNYLFSCAICNRTYKRTLFPVNEDPRPIPPRQRPSKKFPKETPLLLDPFGAEDPADHLHFYDWGDIIERNSSPYGKATILICGLDRPALVNDREPYAIRAYELASELRKPPRERDPKTLRDCYRSGREDSPFSGMVRSILRQEAGIDWKEVVKRRAREIAYDLQGTTNRSKIKDLEEQVEEMGRERFEYSEIVRDIYERICGIKWEELIKRRARQLLRMLRTATEEKITKKARIDLYDLACCNSPYAPLVKDLFERQFGEQWTDFQRILEKDIKPIKPLKVI